eukprot:gene6098-7597_t
MKYLVSLDGNEHSHKAYELAKNLYKEGDMVYIVTVAKPNTSNNFSKGFRLEKGFLESKQGSILQVLPSTNCAIKSFLSLEKSSCDLLDC